MLAYYFAHFTQRSMDCCTSRVSWVMASWPPRWPQDVWAWLRLLISFRSLRYLIDLPVGFVYFMGKAISHC